MNLFFKKDSVDQKSRYGFAERNAKSGGCNLQVSGCRLHIASQNFTKVFSEYAVS